MSYSSEVLADSPLAYWHLDETTGSTLADASGNGRALTNGTGSPAALTLGIAGKIGTAVMGSGSNNGTYAKIAGAAWMDVATWTVDGWFNLGTATGSNARVITREAGPGQTVANDYIWSIHASSSKILAVAFRGGGARIITGATTLSANTWYHVALTWDGTTLRLYINGVLDGSDTPGGAIARSTSTDIVLLNARDTGGGLIYGTPQYRADEWAFYGTALTAARLLAHYNAGIALTYADAVAADSPLRYSGARRGFTWVGPDGVYSPLSATSFGARSTQDAFNFLRTPGHQTALFEPANVLNVTTGDSLTVEAAVKLTDTTADARQMIADKTAGNPDANRQWCVYWDNRASAGSPQALVFCAGASDAGFTTPLTAVWSGSAAKSAMEAGGHLACVCDAAGVTIYWDGAQVAHTSGTAHLEANSVELWWGVAPGPGAITDWHDFLDGHVAHFALYDHALTATRVAAHAAAL